MKTAVRGRSQRAFTLVEMLIAIAVAGILITLAAPSFRDFILMQRLKAVNAQLVTDLQYARSEAVARNQFMRLVFRSNDAVTCYTIFTSNVNSTRCNCTLGAGSACTGTMQEVRTVQVPLSDSVQVRVPTGQAGGFAFDHVSGGIMTIPVDDASAPMNPFQVLSSIDASRVLRTTVGQAGRVTVCAPASGSVGAPPC